jgi:hypothetical protein
MTRKEKKDYRSQPPTQLYIVWVDGKWRFYKNSAQASRRFIEAADADSRAQLIRYEAVEIVGEANIDRQIKASQ